MVRQPRIVPNRRCHHGAWVQSASSFPGTRVWEILVTEKPLTVDEKVSALASLSKKPKAGQVVYWPNVDGVNIPMDPFGFLESIRHNWL